MTDQFVLRELIHSLQARKKGGFDRYFHGLVGAWYCQRRDIKKNCEDRKLLDSLAGPRNAIFY